MRDGLPVKPKRRESGIVNLDIQKGKGTHWVCFKKKGNTVIYYDPFGDLRPPREVVKYFSGCKIYYNMERDQQYNTNICGHLCLKFLYKRTKTLLD